MAVKIRLKRMGRRNRAFYRIVAADVRAQRDGRAIERLGWYDPLVEDDQKKISLEKERVEYWLSVGAQPTQTVENILRARGVSFPEHMKGGTKPKAQRKSRKPATAKKKPATKSKAKAAKAKAKPAAKKGAAKKKS